MAPPVDRPPWRWKAHLRTLHIYLSVFATLQILFFASTGLALNHGEALGLSASLTSETSGGMSAALCARPDSLGVVEHLRAALGDLGLLTALDVDEGRVFAQFRRPGKVTEISIERASGTYQVRAEFGSWLRAMAAIHKGEDTGWLGSWLIDLTAAVLISSSLTGMALWMTLPKRRAVGWAMLALSMAMGAGFAVALVFGG